MNYRIFLMLSGLMMMFSVFGTMMMVGALVGDSEAWKGDAALALGFTTICLVLLIIGMKRRKLAHIKYNQIIETELAARNMISAKEFAELASVSLDESRDLLDRKMRQYGLSRTELPGYDANYFRQ